MVQHCSDDDSMTRPLILVTASVDKIVLRKPLSVDVDLKISGSVIWVGKSSIEIQLEVTQSTEGTFTETSSLAILLGYEIVQCEGDYQTLAFQKIHHIFLA